MAADEQPSLVEFLRARYGEREANAWAIHDVTKCDALLYEEDMAAAAARTPQCDCGEPARVRADVEARRRILARHTPERRTLTLLDEDGGRTHMSFYICTTCLPSTTIPYGHGLIEESTCPEQRLLALPYASHPDYRERWKP